MIEGRDIEDFEKRFAEYLKVRYTIAVPSARIGLYLILKALKISRGDEIILSSYNFPLIPNIIKMIGAKPIFIDVDPDTYNIDPKLIKKRITNRTKAIIVTHIEGLPCELNSILNIAKKYNLKIIEDCAHSLGAEYRGKVVGGFGDAAIFSFGIGKHLCTIDGGMIATNNDELADLIRSELNHFKPSTNLKIIKKVVLSIIVSNLKKLSPFNLLLYRLLLFKDFINLNSLDNIGEDDETDVSKFFRYSNFQAAVGIQQLKLIENRIKKRIKNAQLLERYLNKRIKRQCSSKNIRHVYLNYSIQLQSRKVIRKKLLQHGIYTQNTWMRSCSSHSSVSKKLEKNVLYLPIYETLDRPRIIFIANTLNKLLTDA
ncbi:MAG: aminotransferase class I/II-fold pyridoxal phosphate-dependent enzyme [Candidatus Aenigmatarchaeota archaeon]